MTDQKVAVVIGSAPGTMGFMIAEALVVAGWRVWGTYYNHPYAHKEISTVMCNITVPKSVKILFDIVRAEAGKIDLLVTAAFPFVSSSPLSMEDYFNNNLVEAGHVFAISLASQMMNPGGLNINLLGQCTDKGLPTSPQYSASFAKLHNLGASINGNPDYAGILWVCNLLLGPVDTISGWGAVTAATRESYERRVTDGFINPHAVAMMVVTLASLPGTRPDYIHWSGGVGYVVPK